MADRHLNQLQEYAHKLRAKRMPEAQLRQAVDAYEAQLEREDANGGPLTDRELAAENLRRACSSEPQMVKNATEPPTRHALTDLERACGATDGNDVVNDRAPRHWTKKQIQDEQLRRACSGERPLIVDGDE